MSHSQLANMLYEMYDILEYNRDHYNTYKDSSKHYNEFHEFLYNLF